MDVLLTNDDGIEATGLSVLHDTLSEFANVTAVAPAEDKSAVGRAMSHEVTLSEHELGYAVEGMPTDCVIAGVEALDLDPDLVVAGCNRGANLGEYTLGRSGTVSAAVEAAFVGIPALAVSLYIPGDHVDFSGARPDAEGYAEAARATAHLGKYALDAGVYEHADYLNVNAPLPSRATGEMVVTRPSHVYDIGAEREGTDVRIRDYIWDRMAEGDLPGDEGSDRYAVVEGDVSVSPLTVPHTTEHHEALDALAETFPSHDSEA